MSGDALARAWGKTMGTDRKQFDMFFEKMLDGFSYHKIVVDKAGKPIDYIFLEVNHAFEALTGLKRERIIGKKVTEVLLGIENDSADWIGVYGKVALTGEPAQFENHAGPLGKWFKVSAYCPKKGYFVTLFEEISERKKIEEALFQSEKDWERTFDSVPDLIAILDKEHKIVRANRAMAEKLGTTPEHCIGLSCYQCVHGTSVPPRFCPHAETLKDGKEHIAEVHEPRLGGYYSVSTTPMKDDNGQLIGSVHVARDISERKKAEEALRESEKRLSRSQEIAHLGSWELDLKENRLTWSDEVYRIFGLKPQEFEATYEAFLAAVHPDDKEAVDAAYSGSLSEGKDGYEIEHRIIRRDNGEKRFVHEKCTHVRDKSGHIVKSLGMVQDITDHKRAEEALSASEERYRQLVKYAPTGIYEIDFTGPRFTSVNDAMCEMSGYTREELLAKNPFDLLSPESQIRFRQRIGKALAGEKLPENVEYKVITKGGQDLWATLNVKLFVSNGRFYGAQVVAHDITERKEAEKKLEEYTKNLEALVEERTKKLASSALYARRLIEASLDPLVTISMEGKITDVNKATEIAIGCQREELIGSDFSDYFTEPENARAGYKRVFTEGFVKDYPLAIRHKSGKITHVLYNATVYRNEAGATQGVFAAARDITELKKAEEQALDAAKKLKDAERLAAIGATAGMVGHDIRNPLQAITSDAYLAKTDLSLIPNSEEKSNALESLEEIEKNAEYINKIVQDLQDYARPLNPKAEESDFRQIVEKITKNGLPKNVKVSVKVAEVVRKVNADSYYLNRIMFNLITNSIQAMPNGGKLTIRGQREDDDIVISVRDTGIGIPKDVQSKMFTVMFTTKSKGQGFGLPVVKRMTESLGGTVTFDSEEGKGTTFTVRFPPPKS